MKTCKVENCNRPHHGLGFCKRHYNQIKRNGRIIDDEIIKRDSICKVDGCDEPHKGLGYCNRHYQQWKKYGYITNISNRTIFDLNEIIKYDNYAEIILYDRQGKEVARALIDVDDIDKCKDIKWYLNGRGYVYNDKVSAMHRFVMDCPNDLVVDHINHNKLDNRKSNLRICNSSENNMNISLSSDNRSGFVGVSYCNTRNKWIAQIQFNDKRKSRRFSNKSEAIRYRISLEIKYHKGFMTHYQLLKDALEDNDSYDIDDILLLDDLDVIQNVINNIFTDSLLKELGLLDVE